MSIKKFKFVSPGVFINEIDNSQITDDANVLGPLLIGRAERGPAGRPVRVRSFSDFIDTFGNPVIGGRGTDVWRNGNYSSTMYATFAAQAYLRNNSPLTFIRLLGQEHTNRSDAGRAGWQTDNQSDNLAGGAWGLFLIDSGTLNDVKHTGGLADVQASADGTQHTLTGALAAIIYCNEGSVKLKGTPMHPHGGETAPGLAPYAEVATGSPAGLAFGNMAAPGENTISGAATPIQTIGDNQELKMVFLTGDGMTATEYKEVVFNFNRDSDKYIRKVLNTNPARCNSTINATAEKYWLGETFDRHLEEYVTGSGAGKNYGILLALKDDGTALSSIDQSIHRRPATNSRTPWIISQDLQSSNVNFVPTLESRAQRLFRFHSRETGEWEQKNLKVSISDVKKSNSRYDDFGKFTVLVRKAQDSDNALQIVERFSDCNLNPESPDFVGKKIGDKYVQWSDSDGRFIEYGNHPNNSRFIRIELHDDVRDGIVRPNLLPYGSYGPIRFTGFTVMSGTTTVAERGTVNFHSSDGNGTDHPAPFIEITASAREAVWVGPGIALTASFVFPAIPLRKDSKSGSLSSPKAAFFGIDTTRGGTSLEFERSYTDIVRALPSGIDTFEIGAGREYQYSFSLDDLQYAADSNSVHAVWVSGSRASGDSITAASGSFAVIDAGFNKFTVPLYGGFDGLDIKEKDPFRNTLLTSATSNVDNYALYSIDRAIQSVRDPEVVEFNLASIPGVTDPKVTDSLIKTCEDRGDALAIIDLEGDYVSEYEGTSSETSRLPDVDTTINNLVARAMNSSYACAYFPWVQIRDEFTNRIAWMPPSVAALGTLGSSAASSELWFAPAGFVRGGLTEGSAGLPVVGVRSKLVAEERDKLYAANVNPIASFPSEGIVIFGQKTLQVTPSALDRINVRRAVIFIKKEISRIASRILFEQNVQSTWNRFLDQAEPFLGSIKSRLGLQDYKLVLDSTTTTEDLVDRNIMYAKVFLKPAKAIEFIAIDFSIAGAGAAFTD